MMTEHVNRGGLRVDERLARFIDERALAGTGIGADSFWAGAAAIFERFVPRNRELLAERDRLQAAIDAWHIERTGVSVDPVTYQQFLRETGYLRPDPAAFSIDPQRVDDEIARIAGP